MKYAHFSINDFRAECEDHCLSLEEEGFLNRFTLLAMRRGGYLVDDDAPNARMFRVDVRMYRRVLSRLLMTALIERREGKLTSKRVLDGVTAYQGYMERASKGGKASAEVQGLRRAARRVLFEAGRIEKGPDVSAEAPPPAATQP